MPRILSFNSRQSKGKYKQNIFSSFWDFFSSLDTFTKSILVTLLCFAIVTPLLLHSRQNVTTHAMTVGIIGGPAPTLPGPSLKPPINGMCPQTTDSGTVFNNSTQSCVSTNGLGYNTKGGTTTCGPVVCPFSGSSSTIAVGSTGSSTQYPGNTCLYDDILKPGTDVLAGYGANGYYPKDIEQYNNGLGVSPCKANPNNYNANGSQPLGEPNGFEVHLTCNNCTLGLLNTHATITMQLNNEPTLFPARPVGQGTAYDQYYIFPY